MENYIELKEENGITNLKINGQQINKILYYQVDKKELDQLELTLRIKVNSKKSSVNI